MKKVIIYSFSSLIIFAALILSPLFHDTVSAQTCEKMIAQVVSVQGSVQVKKAGETQWLPVELKDTYCSGDMIRVMGQSRAAILLVTGGIIRLDENTTLTFNGVEKEKTSLIEILRGIAHFFSRWPRSLKVYTPFVNGTVEGTEFLVKVDDEKTFISIFEGEVEAENKAGSLTLTGGQSATAKKDHPPVLQIVVHPRDAVQWALYYPQIIPLEQEDKISKLLYIGRVDEAKAEIERILSKDAKNSQALALKSIIAVVQNEKENALSLAKKAAEADPKSASACIALSYAQQAHFDLKGALESLKEAVNVEPENALAWARFSEIQLSLGNLDGALEAAHKAVELNPNIARTQSVLGFAYLAQVKTMLSKEAFEKAIELDQAAPLPRLGLGLAKIRDGCLEEGRKEIEIAVSLDPDNSLIRSYLGKAYYEEKQDKMAEDQYGMAKDFDPKDPTPFFYDAIRKQSINRPVEALHDMEKAIELNDNRAVYRSKMLLDSDLAARSASLARIYTDLGFQDLALVEGWKSVNTDPANYSAHRFLSDSYSVLPRHEIARVSELLQSQLLQPININPVQPHLAESNLYILKGAGPSDMSFNEFTPLFNRNRISLQASGLAGGDSTFGDELVVSGIHGKVSFSLGQFHYETDGYNKNRDQQQDIYNVFTQIELSPKTSVQAEFRSKDYKRGDLDLLFDPEEYLKDLRDKENINSVRFGIRHAFTPNSNFIASVIYHKSDINWAMTDFVEKLKEKGILTEVQYLYRTEQFSLISGAGYFDEDSEVKDIFFGESSTTTTSPHHTNLYLYLQINYPKQVTWTIGGSADFFKGQNADKIIKRDQFNPKFGLIWNLLPGTTLRAAVFRTLKRSLLTDQTIEPTQVAGFNQFFDDVEGTEAWRYGIGIDQKFSSHLFGGVEFSKRDLNAFGVVYDETGTTELIKSDYDEKLWRAYIYYTPHEMISLSAEYQYEQFKNPREFMIYNISELNTHRVLFGINFFHPSGFSVKLKPQYIYQHGDFAVPESQPDVPFPIINIIPKDDHFWVFDTSVSYRLPKRFGILSIEARNMFDKEFNFQDTDPSNPSIYPKRLILAKFTLAF
jgi:tetratricopeptide (TPR) repeat protein